MPEISSTYPHHSSSNLPSYIRHFILTTISLALIPIVAILLELLSHTHLSSINIKHSLLNRTNLITVLRHPTCFPPPPYTLYSTRVVLPSHQIRPAYIAIDAIGNIQHVTTFLHPRTVISSRLIVDVSPLVVMPGLIDPHVHVNEPGRESWEGFYHATRAAAAGGTTAILDMPLNNIPSTLDNITLTQKMEAFAAARPVVDVGFIGGITPANMHKVEELVRGGVIALKSFMVDSQSKDFPHVSKQDLKTAIQILHRLATETYPDAPPVPYMLHAELDAGSNARLASEGTYNHESYAVYEASRPMSWELEAVQYASSAANNSKVHLYIAHVSAHQVIEFVANLRESAKLNTATLSVETCPHYLIGASEEIPDGATLWKCSPPIRSAANRAKMRTYTFADTLSRSVVDVISSDHSPCPISLKQTNGNLTQAWGGIFGLQYRLQGTWTAAKAESASLIRIVELLAEGPALKFGLNERKGFIQSGLDADIVIWDPDKEESLDKSACLHRIKASPYHGTTLQGVVHCTLLRGRTVFSKSAAQNDIGSDKCIRGVGNLLRRSVEDGRVMSEKVVVTDMTN